MQSKIKNNLKATNPIWLGFFCWLITSSANALILPSEIPHAYYVVKPQIYLIHSERGQLPRAFLDYPAAPKVDTEGTHRLLRTSKGLGLEVFENLTGNTKEFYEMLLGQNQLASIPNDYKLFKSKENHLGVLIDEFQNKDKSLLYSIFTITPRASKGNLDQEIIGEYLLNDLYQKKTGYYANKLGSANPNIKYLQNPKGFNDGRTFVVAIFQHEKIKGEWHRTLENRVAMLSISYRIPGGDSNLLPEEVEGFQFPPLKGYGFFKSKYSIGGEVFNKVGPNVHSDDLLKDFPHLLHELPNGEFQTQIWTGPTASIGSFANATGYDFVPLLYQVMVNYRFHTQGVKPDGALAVWNKGKFVFPNLLYATAHSSQLKNMTRLGFHLIPDAHPWADNYVFYIPIEEFVGLNNTLKKRPGYKKLLQNIAPEDWVKTFENSNFNQDTFKEAFHINGALDP